MSQTPRATGGGLGDYFDGGHEPFQTGTPVPADAAVEVEAATEDPSMIRSEEQMRLSTVTEAAGRVRLRKTVVTEEVTTTVTVRREVVEVEREPVYDDEVAALPIKDDVSEGDYEVVLYAERVVVSKVVVPVERVRIARRVVIEDQQVNETLRKEHIEAETYKLP